MAFLRLSYSFVSLKLNSGFSSFSSKPFFSFQRCSTNQLFPTLFSSNALRSMASKKKKKKKETIKVLMIRDHPKIGVRGQEVEIKKGYFRNLLLPARFAVYATPENKAVIGPPSQEKIIALENQKKIALSLKKISKIVVQFKRHIKPTGEFHAPVTVPNIVEKLFKQFRIEVKESQISIRDKKEGITELGLHEVDLEFEGNIFPLKLNIAKR